MPFYIWLGFYKEKGSKDFKWLPQNKSLKKTWTLWATSQPDNKGGNQNCGSMMFRASGKWNDLDCDKEWPYVCMALKDGKFNAWFLVLP